MTLDAEPATTTRIKRAPRRSLEARPLLDSVDPAEHSERPIGMLPSHSHSSAAAIEPRIEAATSDSSVSSASVA